MSGRRTISSPRAILALLTGLNFLNYLDRILVAAVLPKMSAELGLSDFQGGLTATVFLLGYFVTAPVFKPLTDSPALTGGATPPGDGFFDVTATFVGAVGSTDWTAGWTAFPEN